MGNDLGSKLARVLCRESIRCSCRAGGGADLSLQSPKANEDGIETSRLSHSKNFTTKSQFLFLSKYFHQLRQHNTVPTTRIFQAAFPNYHQTSPTTTTPRPSTPHTRNPRHTHRRIPRHHRHHHYYDHQHARLPRQAHTSLYQRLHVWRCRRERRGLHYRHPDSRGRAQGDRRGGVLLGR